MLSTLSATNAGRKPYHISSKVIPSGPPSLRPYLAFSADAPAWNMGSIVWRISSSGSLRVERMSTSSEQLGTTVPPAGGGSQLARPTV
jgi:hypothetical protein